MEKYIKQGEQCALYSALIEAAGIEHYTALTISDKYAKKMRLSRARRWRDIAAKNAPNSLLDVKQGEQHD